MEEELCSRCYRSESQVKLLDAIDNTKMVKICEECAITDEIPIIRKPSSYQLTPSRKSATVYQRLAKLSGVQTQKAQQQAKVQEVMKKITSSEPQELSIKQRQALATQTNKPLNLIDNFHWHIQMARRKRKITSKQLAEAIGEQEEIIKLIESGEVPDDASRIINKIEQYLSLKLTKQAYESEQARLSSVRQPSRVLSFDPNSLRSLTISDLLEMKKQKEQVESEEKAELNQPTTLQTEANLLGDDIELIDE